METVNSVGAAGSYLGGQLLRGATALVALRPTAKPLHPHGCLRHGTLRRFGNQQSAGVAWLDETGQDQVLVRQSRAIGLPAAAPDFFGLALKVQTDHGFKGDLLFASGGLGPITRFTLTMARAPQHRPLTTLMPYKTPAGALLLSATFQHESRLMLAWAIRSGPWRQFAELTLGEESGEDETRLSFDPVRNALPGMENYAWVRRLREPSYTTARRSRRS